MSSLLSVLLLVLSSDIISPARMSFRIEFGNVHLVNDLETSTGGIKANLKGAKPKAQSSNSAVLSQRLAKSSTGSKVIEWRAKHYIKELDSIGARAESCSRAAEDKRRGSGNEKDFSVAANKLLIIPVN